MQSIMDDQTPNDVLADLRRKGWKTQKFIALSYGMTSNELGYWLKSKGWKLSKGQISNEAKINGFAVNGRESTYGMNPLWDTVKLQPYLEQDGYLLIVDKHEKQLTKHVLQFIGSWNTKVGRAVKYNSTVRASNVDTLSDIHSWNHQFMYPFKLHEEFQSREELKECLLVFDELVSQRPEILADLGHRELLDKYITVCRDWANNHKPKGVDEK